MSEASSKPAPAEGFVQPKGFWLIMSGLMLVMLMASLDQTIVSTALPTIVGDLGGLEHISWVVTAYLLAMTAVTPLYGKLGDLYGRKIVLQAALTIFLIGSVLCGLSQNMFELIAFRAVQGLGGGGLMVGAQAAIGDIVPPRERGRYNGLFGAVFAVSAVAGPLLGGFLTSSISWRFIFYVNVPIGIFALTVIGVVFKSQAERVSHKIDYLGAGTLALGVSMLVLLTSLGGSTYDWVSVEIIGMAALSILSLVAFVFVERRAAEPVLPIGLLTDREFAVMAGVSAIIGFALFGSLTYLPLFQQVVHGLSPTSSGLQLVPMMAGLLVASIGAGLLLTKTGRYKIFPVVGTALAAVGMYLLSTLTETTSSLTTALFLIVLGIGIGLTMQVLVVAVQNVVSYEYLGVATSGVTLFRSVGGSLGTAILGAVFTASITGNLESAGVPAGGGLDVSKIAQLPAAAHELVIAAFTDSFSTVMLVASIGAVIAFLVSLMIREVPLRETVRGDAADSLHAPYVADPLQHIARALARTVGRDRVKAFIEKVATDADVFVSPLGCWLLSRINDLETGVTVRMLAEEFELEIARVEIALEEIYDNGLVTSADLDGHVVLTDSGAQTLQRLFIARHKRLEALVEEWDPVANPELEDLVTELENEFDRDPPKAQVQPALS